jgi:alpha-tubulin suppressor-like RCC1 family protein
MRRKNQVRCPQRDVLVLTASLLLVGCGVSGVKVQMAEGGVDSAGLNLDASPKDLTVPSALVDAEGVDSALEGDSVDVSSNADRADSSQNANRVDASPDGGEIGSEKCGNGVCGIGETQDNCCSDCGCKTGSVCSQNVCITPVGITAGGYHSCLLLQDGTALCWGNNSFGELGNGAASLLETATPTPVSGLTSATALSAGATFTCAILADQTVKCWGDNSVGQLGNGTKSGSALPVPVSNLLGVTAIATGYDYACAVVVGGTAKCWGNNSAGQLGDGTTTQSSLPVAVKDLSGASGLAAGFNSTCTLLTDGTAKCWGDNSVDQLGNSTGANSTKPVMVLNLDSATSIAALDGATPGFASNSDPTSFCAVLADGSAKCWGSNSMGELGIGSFGSSQSRPTSVKGLEGAQSLAGGKYFACTVTTLGAIDCWGNAQFGVLGTGIDEGTAVLPARVSGIGNAVAVAAGTWHACALLTDASVLCWGSNTQGQLGNDTVRSSMVPISVFGDGGTAQSSTSDSGTDMPDQEIGSAHDAAIAYDR